MRRTGERVQAVVVGGGVVGCAVLWELARHGVRSRLIEAEPDVGEGTSKANSAIVHTGFDAKEGTSEAALLRRAAERWPTIVEDLGVPFLPVGALMLARSPAERLRLRAEVAARAGRLGVVTEWLEREDLRAVAPYVTDASVGALSIPGESIVDPFWLTRAYAESAIARGAQVLVNHTVAALDVTDDRVIVTLDDGTRLQADQVFNCAGLDGDDVARLAGDESFELRPRKGQFLVSEEAYGVDRIILPLPGPRTKGVLVTPIIFGGVLLGPTAEDQTDKSDRSVDPLARDFILDACRQLVPAVERMLPIRQFAGVRAVSSTGDYILRPASRGDRIFHVVGIRSTGISASPALAEHAVAWAAARRGWPEGARSSPRRRSVAFEERAGGVVCLCRSIGHGEVAAAGRGLHRPITLDALKRRCGVAFGDCQGNLCAVETALLAAALAGESTDQILKHRRGSWVFAPGGPDGNPVACPAPAATSAGYRPPASEGTPDLVVVGAGLAGIGCALAAAERGFRPVIVERRSRPGGALRSCLSSDGSAAEREALADLDRAARDDRVRLWCDATVTGLATDGEGWELRVQDRERSQKLRSRRVVVATGGYVQPREHLPIAGPRGSGIVTADFVHASLDADLRPGRAAVVVGDGRFADATAIRLSAAGVEVVGHLAAVADGVPVEAVRGERRLEAVRVAGQWIKADLLVLAHRLLPAAFFLRDLGLLDLRPGQPVPVDSDGATSLAGLWAVGTCARPDVDHRASLEAGRRLGRELARRA